MVTYRKIQCGLYLILSMLIKHVNLKRFVFILKCVTHMHTHAHIPSMQACTHPCLHVSAGALGGHHLALDLPGVGEGSYEPSNVGAGN